MIIAAKTFYEMDSGFGIPVGIVVFVLLVVKMLGGLDFGSGSPKYKPTDWEKHWAEQEKRKKWKEEYQRKRDETKG